MGFVQRIVIARVSTLCEVAVQHYLENLGFQHPDLELKGALGRSYSSRVYFRKLHQVLRMCRSASMDRSALWWLTSPPRYTKSWVCVYTWPAASMLNTVAVSGIPFLHKHTILVKASGMVESNGVHTHDLPLPELLGQLWDNCNISRIYHTPIATSGSCSLSKVHYDALNASKPLEKSPPWRGYSTREAQARTLDRDPFPRGEPTRAFTTMGPHACPHATK